MFQETKNPAEDHLSTTGPERRDDRRDLTGCHIGCPRIARREIAKNGPHNGDVMTVQDCPLTNEYPPSASLDSRSRFRPRCELGPFHFTASCLSRLQRT